MAIDLNKLKSKLEELKTAGSRAGAYKPNLIWKPTTQPQDIRLVPYVHQKDNPFIELFFYYFMKPRTYFAPCTHGHPDPILEYVNKLRASSDPQDLIYAKKMQPTKRVYVPILVRGSEHEGVKFWGIGTTIHAELMEKILNPDYGDITDLMTGSDITVTVIPKEQTIDGKFAKQKFDVRRKPSLAFDMNDQNMRSLIENQPNIYTVFKEPTYDELSDAFNNWLTAGEKEEMPEENSNIPTTSALPYGAYNVTQQPAQQVPIGNVQTVNEGYKVQPSQLAPPHAQLSMHQPPATQYVQQAPPPPPPMPTPPVTAQRPVYQQGPAAHPVNTINAGDPNNGLASEFKALFSI